jgi:DNA-binding LacI/PurR family transcriptional regulator
MPWVPWTFAHIHFRFCARAASPNGSGNLPTVALHFLLQSGEVLVLPCFQHMDDPAAMKRRRGVFTSVGLRFCASGNAGDAAGQTRSKPANHCLAGSRTNIGVLVETSSAHGRGVIQGIAEYARQKATWSLHLEESGPLRTAPRWLQAWKGQGIIARIETPGIARILAAKGIPIVNVSGRTSPPGVAHVDTDNHGVCELAVDYFVQRGFKHFAYCGNPRFEWSAWRQEVFAKLIAANRATCAIFQQPDTPQGRNQLGAWLKSLPKPVALLACNDLCGRGILEACEQSDLAVP